MHEKLCLHLRNAHGKARKAFQTTAKQEGESHPKLPELLSEPKFD